MKIILKLFLIMDYIAAIILLVIIFSIAQYLIENEIVKLRHELFEYIYYFGVGVLSYYAYIPIIKPKKSE